MTGKDVIDLIAYIAVGLLWMQMARRDIRFKAFLDQGWWFR